jgi:uncharacterized membrane protein
MQFGMMDSYGNGMGYGMGILGLIFWILVIIGLVLLIKYLWEGGQGRREQESALEILCNLAYCATSVSRAPD